MEPAPSLAPVAALLGTWRGEGAGSYPTIEDFTYTDEVVFSDVGKPFLHYVQRSWSADGSPMHTETGYLRIPGAGTAELILAQPMGQTELAEGTVVAEADSLVLEFQARVANSATAKQVDATRRRYELTGDRLVTTFAMAAVGQPMTHHLHSDMRRV
ncbi:MULTISPECIES: FABP family protein [Dietzia]|uniref:FABP family protein n=1 Tax=Dietzia TaxID=37914 RepID=UPI0015F89546|nr:MULTISPECIES: FABP family protein [Dietzia]MBB1037650.1 FABP family protein [Dietzia natronolimnaea]MBB1040822.1 FABP family protein [Dietzia sp. Cai40]MBB1045676.1 FABP family protein [Dietzia sp. DQ11-44]